MISAKSFIRHDVQPHSLDAFLVDQIDPDWLVVDSFEIPSILVGALRSRTRVLAIVDSDSRSIDADIYLDHNVGAETLTWAPNVAANILAGSRYALVRESIRDAKRNDPWALRSDSPQILAVMGGSDPTGMIVEVARALAQTEYQFTATLICTPLWRTDVDRLISGYSNINILEPTKDLPALLGQADLAISAAGTSSWELCTMGIPSVLIEVVDNQTEPLTKMVSGGLVLGVVPSTTGLENISHEIRVTVERLIDDVDLRRSLSDHCLANFDGGGASRVVAEMERVHRGQPFAV
jgi:spore coat polysaccharide biosynthesis predicted glycosyltransferase SpsG